MAPKKSAKAPGGGADKDGAQEEPLAAVILADTFSRAFAPLDVSAAASSSAESIESCALLRPFLNVPLLSLHLRALSLARVEQVYILSISHADVLREHLTAHPAPPGMEVTTVRTPEARSVGDSLREIDARQVIRGEFLLVQPDAIVGMDLAAIVEAHRARKLKDKDTAMTLCAMQVGENARSRCVQVRTSMLRVADDCSIRGLHAPLHVLNGNSQLLHYAAHGVGKAVEIPNEVLFLEEKEGGDGELEVRADLVEAGIDVCGAEVSAALSRTAATG
jgi:translation initiation factor eIF-2B subunit epsilon